MKNVKQFLVGGMIRKVKVQVPGSDPIYATITEDWGSKIKTDKGDFDKQYILHEFIVDSRHIKEQGGEVSEKPKKTVPKLNNEGGYDYSNSDQKTAKKVGLITLPKDVDATNCGNCIFFNSDFCYHKKIKLPVTSRMCCSYWDSKGIVNAITDISDVSFGEAGAIADTKLNDNGGLDYSGEAIEKAKNADLITLPKDVFGTNCSNCQFFSDGNCGNKNVMLPVTGRMSCSLWNNKEVNRTWGEMKEIFFKNGGSIKKLLTGGEVGTPEWTNDVITRANIDFDVLQMNPVAEDYVKYIREELKLQCENPKAKSEKYYRDWLLTQEASMKGGGKMNSVKSKLKNESQSDSPRCAARAIADTKNSKSVKSKLKNSGLITVKTPRSEKTISVGDITAEEAIKTVKDKYPNFTEFEYKKITYKKTGKKGEFIKRIDPPEAIEARWQKKKDAIRQLSENIRSLRNTVSRDLNSSDEKTALTALAVAIMDKTAERPGNEESCTYVKQSKDDKRKRAYGVTGFKRAHVTILGNKVHLNYIGKKGVPQEKSFSDDKIAKALKRAIKNCKGEFIFETNNCNITASIVNEYLEPFHVTAKNIRGYSANRWVLDKLKSITPEDSDKKRKKQLSGVLKQIAERVGHGPSVLRNQYLMPEVMDTWIEKGELFDMKKAGYVMRKGGGVKSKLGKEDPFENDPDIIAAKERAKATEKQLAVMYEELKNRNYEVVSVHDTRDEAEDIAGDTMDVIEKSDGKWQVIRKKMNGGGEVEDANLMSRILNTLKGNDFYTDKGLSFENLVPLVHTVMKEYLSHDKGNPIITKFNEAIYFEPNQEHIDREGIDIAQIEYATHFITGFTNVGSVKKRSFDKSKFDALQFLIPVLKSPDVKRLRQLPDVIKNRKDAIVYAKEISIGKGLCIILIAEISVEGVVRAVTFLPKDKCGYIQKQEASNVWLDASVIFSPPNETPPSDKSQTKAAGGSLSRSSNSKDKYNFNTPSNNFSLKLYDINNQVVANINIVGKTIKNEGKTLTVDQLYSKYIERINKEAPDFSDASYPISTEKSSSGGTALGLSDDPIISRAHDKDTKNIQVGGNYQFKNNHGSFTSVKVMPIDENLRASKEFFTVEIKVRRKDGEVTRIQTRHKTFPISEYDAYISDLKKRIGGKSETA